MEGNNRARPFAVDVVSRGEAELAISQSMEVLAQPGVELVGLLPPELQDPPNFVFAASILVTARDQEGAKSLIEFLSGPVAAAVFRVKGMTPG